MIELITIILSIIVGFIQWYNESEKVKKRNDHERDKEIARKDHIAKSRRLSDLLDAVKLRNAKKGSDSSSR